jgi:NitT/TauT family transport system substrate-binding protein
VAGPGILESTKPASNIIAGVFVAKKAWVESHRKMARQLYEGWMKGAAHRNYY